MSDNKPPRGTSFMVNLRSGDYGFLERTGRVLSNVGRKIARRQNCCGNYGDPGC